VTAAACIFAGANAAATAIYRRGGTLVTVFLIRCVVVYVFNGAIVARREGRAEAVRVLLLQTGRSRSSCMASARSLIGSILGILLNLSFVLLTFADAFTIFKGIDTVCTILVSRALLGSSERLALRELGCGALTFIGIFFIAQPPLFAGDTLHVSLAGLLVAAAAGTASGGFNVFTRALSRKGGPHDGVLPPAMLLSYFMVFVFVTVALVALLAHLADLPSRDGWDWTGLAPLDGAGWLLLVVYCAGILSGQLLMAAGYATTRAGVAAFLALTELAFSYALRRLPTTLLTSLPRHHLPPPCTGS
jgi:drug/metabolite transporter (DMT)-like permease